MNIYEIYTLRLLHIGTGVFWAGSVIYLAAFVTPAVNALEQEGSKFMQQLSRTNRLPMWMNILATLNVLSGFRLIMIRSGNFQADWFTNYEGMVLTIGGVLGFGAFMIGLMVSKPAIERMAKIGEAVAKAGGPPTPEQAQEITVLKAKLAKGVRLVAWHLAATVVLMAIARPM
jgi:uncharacterized membrane protein